MWIYLPDSFLSIVEDSRNRRRLLVRARLPGDIERVFPRAKAMETPTADYRFRASLPRATVARALAARVDALAYHNLKAEVRGAARHAAYEDCWLAMRVLQGRQEQGA